jgi:hypothetical protein
MHYFLLQLKKIYIIERTMIWKKNFIALQSVVNPQCPERYPFAFDGDCDKGGFCCSVSDTTDSGYCGEFSGMVNDCNGKSVKCYGKLENTALTTESLNCGGFLDLNDIMEGCELNPKCAGWSIYMDDTFSERTCLKGHPDDGSLVNTKSDELFTSYFPSKECINYNKLKG